MIEWFLENYHYFLLAISLFFNIRFYISAKKNLETIHLAYQTIEKLESDPDLNSKLARINTEAGLAQNRAFLTDEDLMRLSDQYKTTEAAYRKNQDLGRD